MSKSLERDDARVKSAFVPVGDGAPVVRVDFLEELLEIHQDPSREDGVLAVVDKTTGFLTLDCRLTRTGVFDYRDAEGNEWGELRTEDEVFSQESLDSFKQVIVTDDHPREFVDVGNVKDVDAGHVGTDVRRDGRFVRATVTLTDAKTIIAALGGKKQVSCGYTSVVVDDSGELEDGTRYDARQTTIRGNHLAIVDVGRAGPDCALIIRGDGAAYTEGATMAEKKKDTKAPATGGGTEPRSVQDIGKELLSALKRDQEGETPTKDQAAMEKAQAIIDMLTKAIEFGDEAILEAALEKVLGGGGSAPAPDAPPADAPADPPPAEPEEPLDSVAVVSSGDDVGKLRGELDMVRSQRKKDEESFNQRVDQRTALVAQAKLIVDGLDPVGKTDADIMRSVVLAVDPAMKDRLAANAKSDGYLKAAYDTALDLHARRETHRDSAAHLAFETRTVADDKDPDKARDDFFARRDALSKSKGASA